MKDALEYLEIHPIINEILRKQEDFEKRIDELEAENRTLKRFLRDVVFKITKGWEKYNEKIYL
jgi:uncharacterized protein YeeX (DUF496 family)